MPGGYDIFHRGPNTMFPGMREHRWMQFFLFFKPGSKIGVMPLGRDPRSGEITVPELRPRSEMSDLKIIKIISDCF